MKIYIIILFIVLFPACLLSQKKDRLESKVKEAKGIASGDIRLKNFEINPLDSAFRFISSLRAANKTNVQVVNAYDYILREKGEHDYNQQSELNLIEEFYSISSTAADLYGSDSIVLNIERKVLKDIIRSIAIFNINGSEDSVNSIVGSYFSKRRFNEEQNVSNINTILLDLLKERAYDSASVVIISNAFIKFNLTHNDKFKGKTSEEVISVFLEYLISSDPDNAYVFLNAVKFSIKNASEVKGYHNRVDDAIVHSYENRNASIAELEKIYVASGKYYNLIKLKEIEYEMYVSLLTSFVEQKKVGEAGYVIRLEKGRNNENSEVLNLKRQWVIDDYNQNYIPSSVSEDELKWSGSVEDCKPGTISEIAYNKTLRRVNYFRRLAGVSDSCKLNIDYSKKAQAAALMMKANGELNHFPPQSWKCYTTEGSMGAAHSNLGSGENSSSGITGFIRDDGDNNTIVGHRRWVLYPPLKIIGEGSTDNTSALYVGWSDSLGRDIDNYIAWPPEGYVPSPLVFERWSFSLGGADFSSAKISMSNVSNMNTYYDISLNIEPGESSNVGYNTIVWVPNLSNDEGSKDVEYHIKISNVLLQGDSDPHAYEYNVRIINELK